MDGAELLRRIARGRVEELDNESMAKAILAEFDGYRGIVREAKVLYDNARNDQNKVRIMLAMLDFLKKLADKTQPMTQEDQMSDADLAAALQHLMSSAAITVQALPPPGEPPT